MKRKIILLPAVIFVYFQIIFPAKADAAIFDIEIPQNEKCVPEQDDPFCLDLVWDSVLIACGAGLYGSALIAKNVFGGDDYDSSKKYHKSDVNAFDRPFMNEYNHTLDNLGTVTCALTFIALPTALFGGEAAVGNFSNSNLLEAAVMLGEAALFTNGIKDWIKLSVQRERPYMYFDERDKDGLENNDFEYSFLSGHTANAFMGATFTTYVFCNYFPDSKLKWPVIATSYLLASGTGVLRMSSGNHFFTDVLAGAAMGSACGFLVPFVHHVIAERNNSTKKNDKAPQVLVTPYGINVGIKF